MSYTHIKYVMALFLILMSEDVNKDRIDKKVFDNFGKLIINGEKFKIVDFIGARDELKKVHNASR